MSKPWWLWEGAAVRCIGFTYVATVEEFWKNGTMQVRSFEMGCESKEYPQDYLPIENPAVMLAPEWAIEVKIYPNGRLLWVGEPTVENEFDPPHEAITWPQCPDHLKGHTWELPIKPAPDKGDD